MTLTIRPAETADLPGILEIVNDEILNSTAIFSHHAVTLENRRAWFEARRERNFPVLVAVLGKDVLGFASFGEFRPHDGYLHTVEHSVYVHRDHRGQGLGREVMQALIIAARERDVHAMIGGIDADNTASIALHERLGFRHVRGRPAGGEIDDEIALGLRYP